MRRTMRSRNTTCLPSPTLPSNQKALEWREKFFKIYLISNTVAFFRKGRMSK